MRRVQPCGRRGPVRRAQSGRRPQPGLALLRLARGEAEEAAAALRVVLDDTTERRIRARMLPALVEAEPARERQTRRVPPPRRSRKSPLSSTHRSSGPCAHTPTVPSSSRRGMLAGADGAAGRVAKWRQLGMPYEEAQTRVLMAVASARLGDIDTRDIETDAARQMFKRLGAARGLVGVAELSQSNARKVPQD